MASIDTILPAKALQTPIGRSPNDPPKTQRLIKRGPDRAFTDQPRDRRRIALIDHSMCLPNFGGHQNFKKGTKRPNERMLDWHCKAIVTQVHKKQSDGVLASMKNSIGLFRLELIGAAVMVLLGSAMHFAFAWTGHWKPFAIVAAVNESIWEHLKLAFWPGVLWALIMPLPPNLSRLVVMSAKGISLTITATLIVVIFTSYTAVLGRNLLFVDIGTFVFAICIGQVVSAFLITRDRNLQAVFYWPGIAILVLQVLAYSLLTFFPPDHWLFIEARSGLRGIPLS